MLRLLVFLSFARASADRAGAALRSSLPSSVAMSVPHRRLGEATYAKMDKVSTDLFSMTYGAVVTQVLRDYESVDASNEQLEKMGYNIGVRLIDELLAKTHLPTCGNFIETAEIVAKVGFKMFLGVNAEVANASQSEFSVQLAENPLAEFVELPKEYAELRYSGVLCGVIRGALEV